MERMGISNIRLLPLALSQYRDKFSTCYIDYLSPEFVRNENDYWQQGYCSLCSGFFTGNKELMTLVCQLALEKFIYYLDQYRGHSDEQIQLKVYLDNPDLFYFYYGDYLSMISNYVYVHQQAEYVLYNFINHSFEHKNYTKCLEACEFLIQSLKLKKCKLSEDDIKQLAHYYLQCKLLQ